MEFKTNSKKEYALLGLLILGFAFVYLSLCFNNNIWTDEAFTIDLLKNSESYMDAVWFTAGDVHPPLYYLILKPFADIFGVRLFLLKALSIVPMLLTMELGITFVYRRFGFRTAFLYILMLGAIPCAMEYAVQVRMYSWAMLFVTACAFSAVDAYERNKKRDWIVFVLAGVASAYTHYFAFAAVLWIYGFFFLAVVYKKRESLKAFLLAAAVSLAAYLPWLRVLYAQVSGVRKNYWIAGIDKEVLLSYFDTLFETKLLPFSTQIMVLLFGIAFVWLVYRLVLGVTGKTGKGKAGKGARQDAQTQKAVLALLAFFVPVLTAAFGVTVSLLMRPVFIARYLMPCVPLLCFFFAAAWSEAPKKVYAALLAFTFFLGTVVYQDTWQVEYQSTYVPQTEQFFVEKLGENDIIVYNFEIFDFIYAYYFDEEKLVYIEDVDLSQAYDNIWLMDTHGQPEFAAEDLEQYGWTKTFMGNYGIEHDEFKIYRITKKN